MPESPPFLSVVIPVYNEAAIVAFAAAELASGLEDRKLDYEIIFAENGSTDRTPQILEQLVQSNPRIRWLHSPRPNYGAALKQGILEARGEVVVCDEIDLCDLVFYDAALPILKAGQADMVIGSEGAKGARETRPLLPRVAARGAKGTL